MCLLVIKFPICMRQIIMTMQKIDTIAFLYIGCLMLLFYCYLFGQKHSVGRGRTG